MSFGITCNLRSTLLKVSLLKRQVNNGSILIKMSYFGSYYLVFTILFLSAIYLDNICSLSLNISIWNLTSGIIALSMAQFFF
jgi:hypothetical protein